MSVKEQIVPFSWPTKCLFYRAATKGRRNHLGRLGYIQAFGIYCAFYCFFGRIVFFKLNGDQSFFFWCIIWSKQIFIASAAPASVRKLWRTEDLLKNEKMSHYHDDQTKILSPATISNFGKTCTHTFTSNCRPSGTYWDSGDLVLLLFADTLTQFQSGKRGLDYVR